MDLERLTVALTGPDDVERLTLRVRAPGAASAGSEADVHRLDDVLMAAYVGRLADARTAQVRPDALRFHAAGQTGERWEERFARLCRRLAVAGVTGTGAPAGAPAAVAATGEQSEAADGWVRAVVEWPGDRVDGPGAVGESGRSGGRSDGQAARVRAPDAAAVPGTIGEA